LSQIFDGGIPYVIDVNRLKEAFPVPILAEGFEIKHEELEATINVKRGTQRYYGVVNSWRNQMKNTNAICIAWEQGIGLRVLDPAGQMDFAETRTKQKIRQTGKAVKEFVWVNRARLNPIGQQRLDHQMRVAAAIKDALGAAKKELAVELSPVKSLPKPQLIRDQATATEASTATPIADMGFRKQRS
jgi:hypothetical protein